MSEAALARYYAARAREYEQIYARPERQADLRRLKRLIPSYFVGRKVLEIACGTGYWTEAIAPAARHVTACDINPETLEIARAKPFPPGRVSLQIADAHALPGAFRGFDAAFAGFWWSHIPRAARVAFAEQLHRALTPGAVVVLLDNRYVEGSSTPISHTDGDGNTYQRRKLANGTEHVVLKNFPQQAELASELRGRGEALTFIALDYFWLFTYELAAPPPA